MTDLSTGLWVAGGVTAIVWVLSLVTVDYSWVDRIWSIIPVAYLWLFAGGADLADPRLDVMAVLVTLWGGRLTFNLARRGGYARGGQDDRWAVLRTRMTMWQFQIFNLLFIAACRNALLLAITLPALTAQRHGGGFGPADVVAALLFVGSLTVETVADQQQWNFHQRKKVEAAAARPAGIGFLRTGLFRYTRHPNYFCEIALWWVIFSFGAIAAGSAAQWTIAGALLLTLLFVFSTIFTETISGAKYPEYADYRRATSAIVPWFPKRIPARRTSRA